MALTNLSVDPINVLWENIFKPNSSLWSANSYLNMQILCIKKFVGVKLQDSIDLEIFFCIIISIPTILAKT